MSDLISIEIVARKIFFIRGVKVMLDRDLAALYGVETRVLNQAVRRNIKRFPKDFRFALTRDEIMRISQIVTSSDIKFAKQVHAFTEQGVAMLSGILNNDRAIAVNIQIMRTFTRLRHMISDNKDLKRELAELREQTDDRFQIVFETLDRLLTEDVPDKKKIGFTTKEKTCRYDASKKIDPNSIASKTKNQYSAE